MAILKFQDVIGFYQANNDAVYKDLKTAYLGGKLTPFVGAGLSVFCGYKLWPSVLKELSAFIPDEGLKQEALDMIEQFEYLEAAEHIQKHYRPMLRRLQGIVSYDKLEACPTERLYSSAAWILPYLFHNRPLMTTNFDGVLEYVFSRQGHAFERMVEPHDPSMLTQIRQQDIHGLFKLHGDIGRETTSLDRLVFTKSQYDAAYRADGKLMEELKQWYQNQTLLFLGCSLSMDKTMEVLRDVASANPGIRHFAIVGCDPKKYGELLNRFGDLGIDAIFYDDTDPANHDSVRVILEHLLEETNSAAYKKLCSDCRSADPTAMSKRPLMFDSEYFPFSGREKELARLTEFCEAEDRLLWWSVTGPGGMGKSRLVFEFCKKMRTEGWNVNRFEASPSRGGEARRLEELPGWTPDVVKTIVVLDDVQAYMESVCAWMTKMDRTPRSEELRILLLEREGKSISDSGWLGPDFRDTDLDQWCHSDSFLRLDPMTDEQLMAVMTDYAAAAGKTLNAALLLKTLERVDPDFKRPLYALAIADARCQGKDPTNWDRDKILDTLLDRELKFHLDRLQGIFDRKVKISKTIQSQLEQLLADSCLRILFPLEQVRWDNYKKLHKLMDEANMDPEEFCQRLGILATAEVHGQELDQDGNPIEGAVLDAEMKVIALSCPDLLKEHLVLRLAFEGKKSLDLLPEGWHLDPERLIFLRRLFINYPDRLKDQTAFWDQFFSAPPVSDLPAWLYADLLWGCTDVFRPLAQRATDTLNKLYLANPKDETIAMCYAKGLVNLSNSQPPADRAATVVRLEKLYHDHSGNNEVAVRYANGLVNLTCVQSPADRAATVVRLEKLCHDHSGNDEVAVAYANGLYNLTCDQSPEDCAATMDRLEKLYNDHSGNDEVAAQYAGGLVNLALSQTEEADVRRTLARSRAVLDLHSDHADIRLSHAMTWFNLTLVQQEAAIVATVSEIAAFLKAHPDAIPRFKEALVEYLSEHPDHADRYRPLSELGGDSHAK